MKDRPGSGQVPAHEASEKWGSGPGCGQEGRWGFQEGSPGEGEGKGHPHKPALCQALWRQGEQWNQGTDPALGAPPKASSLPLESTVRGPRLLVSTESGALQN